MIKIDVEIEINQPAEAVFSFISNFENNPQWQAGMIEAKFTSNGELAVGSTYEQVAKFLGRRIISTFEVVEYEPNRKVKATTISSSFPITFTRVVEPLPAGCRVKAIIEGDSTGFFKLAEPLMRMMVQKSINKDYKNLKSLLEKS